MKKKTIVLSEEENLALDLTMHDVPASLITEFAEKIVKPYYNGNLNAAIQDLLSKAISDQDYVHSHITHIRNSFQKSS
jgi:2-hydroxy-3-keto-5-methylthiopentenyl-1-phosphate phosphatase